ncbi:helix-turn-helix transcriptional regulator [Ruegeria profundi]|uniref:helix-turn-helix transcriptional regulator n=1 Tax=Ruegeria profundi TaxID=1685378 RepID=UPI003C7D7709
MQAHYLTAREAAQYTGINESYLAKLRMGIGDVAGPRFIRIGLRSIRYKRSDLDAWMTSRSEGLGGTN